MSERRTLANGLVVLVEERPTAETVALQLTARAGSRDDATSPGLTVLTSRLMFQGTSRYPSETDLQRAAAQVGGTLARGTGAESSDFAAVMPAREVTTGLDLLASLVVDPLLAADAFGRQVQIALQELGRQASDPGALMTDLYQRTMYAGHPLASNPLGSPETLAALSVDAVRAHRRGLWGGSNLVLALAGRIAPAEAFALAQRALADLPAGTTNVRPAVPAPQPVSGVVVETVGGAQQAQLRVGFRAPPLREDDRFPFRVLNALTAGSSGRLFQEVRNARGLAYTAGSAYAGFTDVGTWFAAAGVDPQNVEPALEVIQVELERLVAGPPDAGEVDLRIGEFAGGQILAAESNAARAARLISQEVFGAETAEEVVRRVREVTPEEVLRVARAYIDPARAVTMIVRPA